MDIKIISYRDEHKKDLKRMIFDFQKYLIKIDTWNFLKFDKEYKEKAVEELLKNVREKQGKIYLAKSDDKVIGYIAGYIVPDKENFEIYPWKRGYVDELYLEEKYRNQRIGKKLLEKIEKYFKVKKCDNIGLNALAANKKAIKFYDKQGFEQRSLFFSKALNKKIRK
ncbi:MAG: GNAT family N-acetyltransferase [Patescibacteria group bacterium]|nr:GNAT family N-acetyltransferase [Patescibacteria group bacterium]